MTRTLGFMLAVSLGGACAGSGTARVDHAPVTVHSPELVSIGDNLYVVADADEPVFYADDQYWLYRDDHWYRSHAYDRGYVHVSAPPQRVRRIQQPTAYIRYRTRNHEARRQTPRDPWRDEYDRQDAPTRLPPRAPQPLQPTQPAQPAQPYPRPPQQEPVEVRDHRTTPPVPHDPTHTLPRDARPHPRDDDRDDDDDDHDDRRDD